MICSPERLGSEKGCNLHRNVVAFIQEHGELGQIALQAWNAVDPFHCLYPGAMCICPCDLQNPDEYLSYAERFVLGFGKATALGGSSPELVEELVRRSFHASQVIVRPGLGDPWASPEDIKAIAQHIAEQVDELKLE